MAASNNRVVVNPSHITEADIIVGIPSYNEADNIAFPTDVASRGLKEHFPGQPIMAYFEFSPNLTQETRQVVQDALLLKAAGLEVKPEEVSEKTGYSLSAP